MNRFAGTSTLTRWALRRDRVLLPVWIAVFVLMTVSSASATMALYPTEASRAEAAVAINDVPTVIAMYGRVWDPTSLGELSLIKLSGFGTIFVALLAILLVVRHTRTDEEAGRTELIGSSVVGAWAQLTAGVIVVALGMVAIGALSAAGLAAVGLPLAGSLAFGLTWASTGIVFASLAAVCAQLTPSARTANAIAITLLAIAYGLRAVGDALGDEHGPAFWSWLSPIGWAQQVRSFAGDRYVILLLPLAFTALGLLVAFALSARRDLGSGLLPDRPGRPSATGLLSTPWGLAWRLQRGLLLGWAVGYVVLSAVVGSIVSDLSGMLDSPQVADMVAALGGTSVMVDAFTAMEFSVIAFVTASYGIAVTRRVSAEEAAGHAEPVLAASVSRTAYLFSHVVVALLGTLLLSVVQALAFALAKAASTGEAVQLGAILGASLAYLPAVWLVTGIAVLLVGAAPRLTYLAWVALIAFLLIAEVGALLSWPSWVLEISPFAHVPKLPAAAMEWAPLIALTAIAGALVAAGAVRFQQRDLDSP